jgi:carbamoyltransferase
MDIATLYICYFGINEPLVQTQVLPYLRQLSAAGVRVNLLTFEQGLRMTNGPFDKLFGGAPRKPESRITQKEMDLARSIQAITEEVMLKTNRLPETPEARWELRWRSGTAIWESRE